MHQPPRVRATPALLNDGSGVVGFRQGTHCDGVGERRLPSYESSTDLIGRATVMPHGKLYEYEPSANAVYRAQIAVTENDLRHAFVKDLTPRQLGSELIASALARWVGMPVPDPYLVFVPNDTLPLSKAPKSADGLGCFAFASADAETPSVARFYSPTDSTALNEICRRLADWQQVGELYGFDTWLANVDRNQGNILFLIDDVFLIDHDQTFGGSAWSADTLIPSNSYTNQLKNWLTPYIEISDSPARAEEAGNLLHGYVEGFDDVIDASFAAEFLPQAEMDALRAFVAGRVEYIPPYSADALNLHAGGA